MLVWLNGVSVLSGGAGLSPQHCLSYHLLYRYLVSCFWMISFPSLLMIYSCYRHWLPFEIVMPLLKTFEFVMTTLKALKIVTGASIVRFGGSRPQILGGGSGGGGGVMKY